jgi:hypothetical protein
MELNDPFPRENFKTKYMQEFKDRDLYSPVKPEPKLYRKNRNPMDLTTSNKEDYLKHSVNPENPIYPIDHKTPNQPAISSTTVNTYNFPHWGTHSVYYEKRFHPPVRSTELPFKGHSSYYKSYSPVTKKDAEAFSTDYTKSTAFGSSFALGPRMRFDDRTTYSDKMCNYSGSGLNSRIKVKPQKVLKIQASPSNFRTTSNFFYASNITPSKKDIKKHH